MCNNTSDRKHADAILERYVTETVMGIVTTFFSSPFSDQSTSLQVTCYNNAKGLKKKSFYSIYKYANVNISPGILQHFENNSNV